MNKCLRIILQIKPKERLIHSIVQQHARDLDLEGLVQPVNAQKLKIIICGKKEKVDLFVDMLHRESAQEDIQDIEIEPFLKDKDYRGVFRVIE
ncbi:acylphosphatase [Candidatus Dependentiae bacterium]|nr:acylphosphatase [Candidatus Dependentiae bacterium]